MAQSLKTAIAMPMNVMVAANSLWPTLVELAKICNINCKSDLQVSGMICKHVRTLAVTSKRFC